MSLKSDLTKAKVDRHPNKGWVGPTTQELRGST